MRVRLMSTVFDVCAFDVCAFDVCAFDVCVYLCAFICVRLFVCMHLSFALPVHRVVKVLWPHVDAHMNVVADLVPHLPLPLLRW